MTRPDMDAIVEQWAEKHREWNTDATRTIMLLVHYARSIEHNQAPATIDARRDERAEICKSLEALKTLVAVYPGYGQKEFRARVKALDDAIHEVNARRWMRWEERDDEA